MQTNKIALVLAEGGAKGYAHIGAIRAIEESGTTITSIASIFKETSVCEQLNK